MMSFKKGALVHAPSGVHLYKIKEGGQIQTYMKLERPRNLLLAEADKDSKVLSVIYDNQKWCVLAKDVYGVT